MISLFELKIVLVLMYVFFLYVYVIICLFVNMYGFFFKFVELNLLNFGIENY